MTAYRRSVSRPSSPSRFQPMPLVAVFLSMLGKRSRKPAPLPQNVDWERDEPMNGLS